MLAISAGVFPRKALIFWEKRLKDLEVARKELQRRKLVSIMYRELVEEAKEMLKAGT